MSDPVKIKLSFEHGQRQYRNAMLQQTDFYALSDVTMSDAMKTYRQALRDITNGLTTTAEVKAQCRFSYKTRGINYDPSQRYFRYQFSQNKC